MGKNPGIRKVLELILSTDLWNSLLAGFRKLPAGGQILNGVSFPFGVYSSFDAASAAAKRTKLRGHEDPGEIAAHLEFSKALRPSDYAVLYWLNSIASDTLRLLDYGGNVGNLFYAYSAYLTKFSELHWTVFDIPQVMEAGRRIASSKQTTRLSFTNSPADIRRNDILLVSGALHYWEKTIREFVRQFPDPPDHILINRTPVHESAKPYFSVQATQTCAFACIVRNANELIAEFVSEGYELRDRWAALELSLKPPLYPDKWVHHYSGFYFQKKVQPARS